MSVIFLQTPKKVSKDGCSDVVASVTSPPPASVASGSHFPAPLRAGMMPVCVIGTPSPLPPMSNLCVSLLICYSAHNNALILLSKAREGKGGTSCLLATQEHKAAAAIAVTKCIKALFLCQCTVPIQRQSPAGSCPSQRHLRGTSLQGCRKEGMIHLYSAIKALILSFSFPPCGSGTALCFFPSPTPTAVLYSAWELPPLSAVTVSPVPRCPSRAG